VYWKMPKLQCPFGAEDNPEQSLSFAPFGIRD
jgi:hypothetical protein